MTNFWKYVPWPRNRIDFSEWLGTITGIIGALTIASNIGITGWGYVIFWFSSTSLMYFAWKLEKWPLFVMNLVFCLINFWGIWRWLLMPLV